MEDIIPSVDQLTGAAPDPSARLRNLLVKALGTIKTYRTMQKYARIPVVSETGKKQRNEDIRELIRILTAKGYTVERVWCPDEDARDEHGFVYVPATEEQTEALKVTWGQICASTGTPPIARLYFDPNVGGFV